MALYWVDAPFTYKSQSGITRIVDPKSADFLRVSYWASNPAYWGYRDGGGHAFDTTDVYWDLPGGWTPPLVGVRPMDSAAQTALNAARVGKTGVQLPGIGILPVNEPIYSP
jgi:hypothetical protein